MAAPDHTQLNLDEHLLMVERAIEGAHAVLARKDQQEPMRHASIQTTMNVYGQAMTESKRTANSKVVEIVLGPEKLAASSA